MMERRQDFCQDNPDDLVCQGISGIESAVTPFLPGNGFGAGPTPTNDILPTGPPQQGASSTILSPSVGLAQGPTSLSFITSLPTARSSFITSLPTDPATGPGTTVTETATPSSANGGQVAVTQSAGPQASGQSSGQKFPVALVAGVGSTIVALIVAGIALWYFFLRKRLRRRSLVRYSDASSVNEITRGGTRSTFHPGMTFAPSDSSRSPGWQHKPPSIHTLGTVSPRPSLAETDTWPEPLSPRPVMQTTILKMTVPHPVDASSFRLGGLNRRSSLGPATPSSTYRQPVMRGPAPGVPPAAAAASIPTSPVELPATPTPRVVLTRLSGKLSSPAVNFQRVPNKRKSLLKRFSTSTPEEKHEMEEQPAAETAQSNGGIERQYSVRKSPLAQNPFVDPGDAEADAHAQENRRSLLRVVNPDVPQEEEQDEKQEMQKMHAQGENGKESGNETTDGSGKQQNLNQEATAPEVSVTPADQSSPSPGPEPEGQRQPSIPPLVKRVSFATNSSQAGLTRRLSF